MKTNIYQQKEKRRERASPQKPTYISSTPFHENQTRERISQHLGDYQKNISGKDYGSAIKRKDMQDFGFMNPFTDDLQSTKQFTRYQNYLSTQNLMQGINGIPNQIKNVRESENIYAFQNNKTPPNSISDKNLQSTKSATHIGPQSGSQFLMPKQHQLEIDEKEEECEQIKELIRKIKEAEKLNEKIKQQNIQLRLLKLSTNSESMQMLSLRLEIQDIKRKIQKLKHEQERAPEQRCYNTEYYASKKQRQQSQDPLNSANLYFYATPQAAKQRNSESNQRNPSINKTPSNIHTQNSTTFQPSSYISPLKPQMLHSPTAKCKQQEDCKSIKNMGRAKQIETQIKSQEYNSYYSKK